MQLWRRVAVVVPLAWVVAGCSGGSGNGGPSGGGGASGAAGVTGAAGASSGGGGTSGAAGRGGAIGSGGTSGGAGHGGGATTGGGGAPAGTGGATGAAGVAGGAGASGTNGTAGAGGTSADAPIIPSLATNVTTLLPTQNLVVTAVVTHPQGIAQVIGGTLNDPGGASYGAFMVSTTAGAYSLTLTWGALETVQDITTPPGGGSRMFVATFYDQAGHSTSKSFTIVLQCPTTTDAICASLCVSVQSNGSACGACGHSCATLYPSLPGVACSQGRCSGSLTTTVLESCSAACQALGLSCTGTETPGYNDGGAVIAPMTMACTAVPPATIPWTGTQILPFDNLVCTCTE